MGRSLSIGAGLLRHESAIHVDRRPLPGIDVVHDLDVFPWPFESDAFDTIYAIDIIEHLEDVLRVIEECWRLLVPGGLLRIRTAYWETKQSYLDPTHRHWFTENSFDFFVPGSFCGDKYSFYTTGKFDKLQAYLDGSELCVVLKKRGGIVQ